MNNDAGPREISQAKAQADDDNSPLDYSGVVPPECQHYLN